MILSWLGGGDRDEADIVHALATFLGSSGSSPSGRFLPRASALLEARDVWRGISGVDDFQNLLPLHFLLPNRTFLQWSARKKQIPPSRFRIICLHRSERTPVSPKLQQKLVLESRVVAMLDLSVTATASLLSQRSSRTRTGGILLDMYWIGTEAEFSTCLHAILYDIWQDRGQQLDAWQQLYALACVKLCFRRMWVFCDEDAVTRRSNALTALSWLGAAQASDE